MFRPLHALSVLTVSAVLGGALPDAGTGAGTLAKSVIAEQIDAEDLRIPDPNQDYAAGDYLDALWNVENHMLTRYIRRDRDHPECDVQTFTVAHPTDPAQDIRYKRVVGKEERICRGEEAEELNAEITAEAEEDPRLYHASPYDGVRSEQYGHWEDINSNGLNARYEVLWRDLEDPEWNGDGTRLVAGTYVDPLSGDQEQLGETPTHVDHIVPVSLSWLDMEHRTQEERTAFYNDPMNLLPTTAQNNHEKGAQGPGSWMPPNEDFHCTYAMIWTNIAVKYELSMRRGNKEVLRETLRECALNAYEGDDSSAATGLSWVTERPGLSPAQRLLLANGEAEFSGWRLRLQAPGHQ